MAQLTWENLLSAGTVVVVSLCCGPAGAATLYVTPNGTGDGASPDAPASIDGALEAAQSGDEVRLQGGYYGDLSLSGRFGEETLVAAAEGQEVQARTLTVSGAEHLTVSGLSISLSHADSYESDTLVSVGGGSSFVTLSDCDIFSVPDAESGDWSASDWAELPGTAVSVRSPDIVITGNRIRNVGYGISINYDAPRATVSYNHIQNFSRDGLRGIADDGLFEYNTVLDAYDVDDHHDDFFQSWSYEDGVVGTTVVRGVVLRGNLFVNFTDPERPFAGSAQGIGCFDGFFEDWVVENNVVIVNHWHGITFLGARNMRIVNNTVLDNLLDDGPGPPWINVAEHKDGSPSSDILIRNNLTQDITLEAEDSLEDHNVLFTDPAALFVDPRKFDLHLLEGAEAVDAGSDEAAPALDFDGIPRPQGPAIDVGAFEWHDGSVEATEPTAPGEPAPATAGSGGGPSQGPGGEPAAPPEDSASADDSGSGGCSCRQSRAPGGAHSLRALLVLLALGAVLGARKRGNPGRVRLGSQGTTPPI